MKKAIILRRFAAAVALNCCLPVLLPAAQSGPPFTMEQILSSPFPSSLTAAANGQRLAWVFNNRGVRNIWVAEGPTFQARQLTGFTSDDGRDISIVGFSHDGSQIIFSRDGRFNPDQNLEGAGGSRLFAAAWSGDAPVELARVSSAAISPVTARIAYAEGGAVWSLALAKEAKPERLFAGRGDLSQLSWSPDGASLVMRSARGQFPHQFSWILLFDTAAKEVRYLDPSVYLDSSPLWSPDGRRVAFLRRLTSDHRGVLNEREFPRPDPWVIRVTDVQTGDTVSAWSSPADDTFSAATLEWLDDRRLVFTSERDGWRHLYAVGADGQGMHQLTSGQYEVESSSVARSLSRVFYTSNAGDIDRRHLWSVGADGAPAPVTSGESIEWSATVTGDGRFVAYLGSGARRPAHAFVKPVAGGNAVRLAPEALPADFPAASLVVPEPVILRAEDGVTVHAQLFRPPARVGKRPAVMFFHGGPVRQMLLGWHYSSYYHNAYALNQYLASRGFFVLSVNFRLGIGYGRKFRDVPDGGPRGATEYRDLLAGARYLRSLADVDADRVGLWGGSYGGLMTALGLSRNSDLFAAGVDFHGVHDWNQWQAWSARGVNDDHRTVWKSSPVADVDSWRSPVLLIHADDDRNVPFSETVWLAKELAARGVEHELLILPDDVHGFLLHRNWVRAYSAAAEFLERKLNR